MKQHWRIFLLLVLLIGLLGVTAFAASATDNYQVFNGSDASVGTYETLTAAKNAVTGDGFTIRLLADVTETANTALNKNFIYTIDGCGHTLTNDQTDSHALTVSTGSVTLKNITLQRGNTNSYMLQITGTPNVTLDGVTVVGGSIQLYMSGAATLTIKGNSSIGAGCGDRIMHLTNGSRGGHVRLQGGTFVDGPYYGFSGSGAEIVVTGGTYTASRSSMFAQMDNDYISPIIINGGDFTATGDADILICQRSSTTLGQTYNGYGYGNDIVRISGGTFNVLGASASAVFCNVTVPLNTKTDGAISGRATIAVSGGEFIGDANAYTLLYGNSSGSDAPRFNVTGGSFSGSHAWIRSAGNNIFDVGGTASFYCNATDGTSTRCIWLHNASLNGQLNITGGTFTVASDNTFINAAGADVTISGGTFELSGVGIYMDDGDRVSCVTISGGAFHSNGNRPVVSFKAEDRAQNPKKGWLEISGGTFSSASGTATLILYSTAEMGTHCTISGGTFIGSNGARIIDGHNDVFSPMLVTGGTFTENISRYVPGYGMSGVTKTTVEGVDYYTVDSAALTPFCGAQLALGKNLSLYLYVILPDDVAAGTIALTVTSAGKVTQFDGGEVCRNYPDGSPLPNGYTLFRFIYAGIAPQRMGDAINVVLKVNGAQYAVMNTYSVKTYCETVLSDATIETATKTLVANLLRYGTAAQAYSGYHADTPVDTAATVATYATDFEAVSAAAASFSGPGAHGYAMTRCGLRFDSINRLYVRFTAPVLSAVRITYSINGGAAIPAVLRDAGDGTYIAYTDGLNLTDFGKTVVFTMQDADAGDGINVITVTCTYSVLSFIGAWQNDAGQTGDLARALGCYYASLKGYLNPFVPVLRFVVISDIHFMTDNDSSSTTTVMPTQQADLDRCVERLTSLFTRSYEYAATKDYNVVDAFMIVGDNTDDGTEKQITDFLSIIYNNIDSEESRLLIVNGNHEFYDTGESGGSSTNHTKTDNRLLSKLEASGITNYNALRFHTTVNGYHFIGFSPTCNGGRAFDDETVEWLDAEIAAAVAEDPTKPVFVCQHQQVYDTVNGSPTSTSGNSQLNIREVLNKYPQVVDFAGHSHSAIDHPGSVWQGEFTAVATGTLAYTTGATNTRGGSIAGSHGDPYNEYNEKENGEFTIVEIDANNRMHLVYIQLDERDNTTPVYIGERIINIVDPATFNWGKDKQASWTLPYFTEGQELTRYDIDTPTSLQVVIPQATCDAGVAKYRCDLYKNGSLVKSITRLSGQYRSPVPQCVAPFTGLTPDTEYTVKVYPISNTGAIGLPIEGTFTTSVQTDVYTPDIFSAQFNIDGSVINAVNGDVLVKNGTASSTLGQATFTGEGDYQWRGIEEYYELFQGTLTFETYAKVTSASRGKFIVANLAYHKRTASTTQLHGGFGFKVESDGRLSFYVLTSASSPSWSDISNATLLTHAVTTEDAYDTDTFVHLVGTYDGKTIKFYVDGELVGSISRAGLIDYPRKITGQYLSIGGDSDLDYNSKDFMTGAVRKVSIYSTAMTDEQIATLYARRNESVAPAEWGSLAAIDDPDDGFAPVVRFAVASDIHTRTTGYDGSTALEVDAETRRAANLFRHTYQYAEMSDYNGVDAIIIAGDYTDYGREPQYAALVDLVNAELRDGTEFLVCLGNHEFWSTGENGSSSTVTTNTYARFEQYFGHAPDSHNVINGYHFIGVSPDCNGGRNYSEAKAAWLEEQLQIAAADDPTGLKPIIVYQHISPANSVYGSSTTTNPNAAYAAITVGNVLKNYPQAVVFAGHSHRPTNDPASISQTDFTTINTGTLAYGCYEIYTDEGVVCALPSDDRGGLFYSSMGDAKNEHGLRESSIYMIVEIDAAGRVRIQYIDADAHCRVGEPIIIDSIGRKDDFTLTAERASNGEAPYFTGEAEITLVSALPNSLRLSFPQAVSRDMVRNYKVEVYRGETLVSKFYRLSNVYFPTVPETLLAPCVDLDPDTEYTVKIYAYNTWGQISAVPLTGVFSTPAADPAPTPDLLRVVFREDGTAYDAVSGNDLVRNGTANTAYEGSLGRTVGVFDGNGDYQWRDIGAQYEIMAGCFSFEALVYADHAPASSYFDICSNQQTGGFGFEYKANGNVVLFVHSETTSSWITAAAYLPVGEYVHLMGVFDGSTIRLYINGELAASTDIDGNAFFPLQPGSQFLSIGGDSGKDFNSTNIFSGRVAVTNLYSAPLTAEQVAALAAQYPQAVLDVRFRTDGTAYNAVTNEDLVKNGSPTAAFDPATGSIVGMFDGDGDYQWRELADIYETLQTSLTLETYIKVDQFIESGWVDLISNQHAGGIGFELKANNQLYFLFYNGTKYDRVGPYTMPVGEYVHLVVTFDNANCLLYANGELIASAECTSSIVFPTEPTASYLSIGGDSAANYNSSSYMTGSIASVRLYTEVLSAEQVAVLYDNLTN